MALAARTVMGLLSASVLSVVGIGVAWGLFVFFGAAAHATLLTLFAAGAGIGAGVGGYIAWLRFDHVPSWQGHLGTVLALALAGAGGAWGGFQFGASQEIACCTGPAITPITYTALGATAVANVGPGLGDVIGPAGNLPPISLSRSSTSRPSASACAC